MPTEAKSFAPGVPVIGRPESIYAGLSGTVRDISVERQEIQLTDESWVPASGWVVDLEHDLGYAHALLVYARKTGKDSFDLVDDFAELIEKPNKTQLRSAAANLRKSLERP